MSVITANLKIFIQTFQSSTKSSNLLLREEEHFNLLQNLLQCILLHAAEDLI